MQCTVPTSSALKAENERREVLKRNISKNKGNPMGVVKMIKENGAKCDLNMSLKPFTVTQRENSISKNASLLGSVRRSINYQKVKNSYYNFVTLQGDYNN